MLQDIGRDGGGVRVINGRDVVASTIYLFKLGANMLRTAFFRWQCR